MKNHSENRLPGRDNSGKRPGFPGGHVALVGAGPGEPSAITLRAIECLQAADVILYDYLVNPSHLTWADAHAELISLGRHGLEGKRLLQQSEINQMIIDFARQGKRVVRLKCGDPVVFARLSEEANALRQANLEFEIVPGVTSALATGSYAGIPLTDRNHASAVALITGHRASGATGRDDSGPESSGCPSHIDWKALARFPGTLVVYMGTTQVEYWSQELLQGGMAPDTPVAIVRRCGFSDQQVVDCRLDHLAETVIHPQRIRPPVVFVIGQTAAPGNRYEWFAKRPLYQTQILLTRPAHQSDSMRVAMERMGASVICWPAIETTAADPAPIHRALQQLSDFDWVVFSSVNGIDYWMQQMRALGLDARAFAGVKLACIGKRTAEHLQQYHLLSDLTPDIYDADHLAAALASEAKGKRFLLVRASRGREILAETLRAAGGEVEQVVVYESRDAAAPESELLKQMENGSIDWVTVTSSAIAENLARCFGARLLETRLASISPITTATLNRLGYSVTAEATTYTSQGVMEAICDWEQSHRG